MPRLTTLADGVFTVADLLTPTECADFIARGEGLGFVPAAVRTAAGPKMRNDIRDNDRVAFTDAALADRLFERCRAFLPETMAGGRPVFFDEDFRYYRYDVGQRFKVHTDGVVVRLPTLRTRLTCLFYLNDDFRGGETVFYGRQPSGAMADEVARVVPLTGTALFFYHEWLHEGRPLEEGRKYVLRSDVFFRYAAD